jgi:hypothetical protein
VGNPGRQHTCPAGGLCGLHSRDTFPIPLFDGNASRTERRIAQNRRHDRFSPRSSGVRHLTPRPSMSHVLIVDDDVDFATTLRDLIAGP